MPQRFENIRRGGYNPFGLTRDYHLDVLGKSLDKMDERHQKALEQATAIDLALGKLELNAAEDAWKADYINSIRKEIDNAAQFGNYSTALSTATKLAGKALSDPGLLGRVRANAAYEEAKKQVLARNDINQVTKDRWLEQNPYAYQDKVDANGNVVGGSEWNPNWRPVSRYDMTHLYGLVKQLAAAEAGGGESAMFMREDGSLTPNAEEGFHGLAVKRGGKWERLSEQKLKNVFDSLFKQAPEAMDALLQDMDDRQWQYNKADDEGKKAFIGSDIMDDAGHMYTPQEYLARRVNPVLKEMSYSHSWSTVDYGNAYANKLSADKNRQAREKYLNDKYSLSMATTQGPPITVDLSAKAGSSYTGVVDAVKNLSSIMGDTVTKAYLNKGDYSGLANYAQSIIDKLPDTYRNKYNSQVRLLRTQGEQVNAMTNGFSKDELNAFRTKMAIDSGMPMFDAKTNPYTRKYSKAIDNLFSYTNSEGKTKQVDNINVVFSSSTDLDALKDKLQLTDRDFKTRGVEVKMLYGKPTLVINRNSSLIQDIATNAKNYNVQYVEDGIIRDDYSGIKQNVSDAWSATSIAGLGIFPSIIPNRTVAPYERSKPNSNTNSKLSALSADGIDYSLLDRKVKRAFEKHTPTSTIAYETQPQDDPTTQILREAWLSGAIETDAQYEKEDKRFQENNINQVAYAMNNPGNLTIYGRRDDSSPMTLMSNEENKEIADRIALAISQNRAIISPYAPNTEQGYGTLITIMPKEGTKNSENKPMEQYYCDGLLKSPAATAIANDPKRLLKKSFENDRALGVKVKNIDGNWINYNSPNAENEYNLVRKIDSIYDDLDAGKANGITYPDELINGSVANALVESGYEPGSDAFNIKYIKIVSSLKNY